MIIAVPTENGLVFQHFGHSARFTLYTVEKGNILAKHELTTGDSGHSALSGLMEANGVNLVICGGIGGGARQALNAARINVVAGARGDATEAVLAFLAGELLDQPSGGCSGHGDGHSCQGHSCGGSCH